MLHAWEGSNLEYGFSSTPNLLLLARQPHIHNESYAHNPGACTLTFNPQPEAQAKATHLYLSMGIRGHQIMITYSHVCFGFSIYAGEFA